MKRTSKRVSNDSFFCLFLCAYGYLISELDALALEEEEEGPSYLADLSKAPDFIDEPPAEVGEVSSFHALRISGY